MKNFLLFLFVILIINNNSSFSADAVKFVLLEEFSTAPCGFCPEGTIIIEELLEKYPNLISFTHHAGFGIDSMTIAESSVIAKQYTNFAPAGVIDKIKYDIPTYTYPDYLGVSRQKWDSVVAERFADEIEAEVKISKNYNQETRMLNITLEVNFLKEVEQSDYRFNIAIVEDSVSGIGSGWDQKNYFNSDPNYPTLYKKGDPIVGYIHRHVLRAMPLGPWGNAGELPGNPEQNKTYTYNLNNFKVPENWKVNDINVVAYLSVYNSSKFKHKVLNANHLKLLGENTTDINNELSESQEIIITPNPTADLIHITGNNNYSNIKIFDSYGRCVYESSYKQSIDISNLSNGIYIIQVIDGNKIHSNKFIKFN